MKSKHILKGENYVLAERKKWTNRLNQRLQELSKEKRKKKKKKRRYWDHYNAPICFRIWSIELLYEFRDWFFKLFIWNQRAISAAPSVTSSVSSVNDKVN